VVEDRAEVAAAERLLLRWGRAVNGGEAPRSARNVAPKGRPPSLPAPQSSASVGLVGSVTSTSWKSPRGVGVKAVVITSANGTASGAKTRSCPPITRLVRDSSWTPFDGPTS